MLDRALLRVPAEQPIRAAAVQMARGDAYLEAKNYDRAIAGYDAALKNNPKQAHSLYGRGLAKQKKGDQVGGDADIASAKAIQHDIAGEFAKYGVN